MCIQPMFMCTRGGFICTWHKFPHVLTSYVCYHLIIQRLWSTTIIQTTLVMKVNEANACLGLKISNILLQTYLTDATSECVWKGNIGNWPDPDISFDIWNLKSLLIDFYLFQHQQHGFDLFPLQYHIGSLFLCEVRGWSIRWHCYPCRNSLIFPHWGFLRVAHHAWICAVNNQKVYF